MQEHEIWLSFAESDLNAAKQLIRDPENAFVSQSLVLSQQSAEKALKGYLYFQAVKPAKTHDLELLIEHCIQFDIDFNELRGHAQDLSPHISISRYPDSKSLIPDLTTAKILVDKAHAVFWFVRDKIY